jgi:hypothetical protein
VWYGPEEKPEIRYHKCIQFERELDEVKEHLINSMKELVRKQHGRVVCPLPTCPI